MQILDHPALIRTLFCPKPESGVHVTEMIIYEMIVLFNLSLATILAIIIAAAYRRVHRLRRFQPRLFSAPENFIPGL